MHEEAPDFALILELLAKHNVDFIVVGGVCAVLLGAPVTTFDLDIVHSRSVDNVERLKAALAELDANYREHLPRKIAPAADALESPGHHLLLTRFGPLDVLGIIGENQGYDELISHCESIELERAHTIQVLDLDTLIDTKARTARNKDLVMLEILYALQSLED